MAVLSNVKEIEEQKTAACLETGRTLIKIIDGIINDTEPEIPEGTDFEKILKLSFSHRISGFVAYGVKNYNIPEAVAKKFESELFKTAARHTAQEREIKELSAIFSQEKVEHCFLKGLKISSLYDVPEMRFMLDIDIFINPEKYDLATELMKKRGYEEISADDKDLSLSKKPFLNIDLHKELKYDYDLGYEFYKNVYERLLSLPDSYEKTMTSEELYVYLLSHTAHHFATAGTGIKSVIDHYYIMKNLVPRCDKDVLNRYLEESGLNLFNEAFSKLCRVWFMAEEGDELTSQMGDYVILSGAYGTGINYYVNSVLRISNDKKSYFLSRLFPKYETMCYRYPVLKKCKVLLPVFWVIRIFSTVFDVKRIKNEATGVAGVETENKEKQNKFLNNVGL